MFRLWQEAPRQSWPSYWPMRWRRPWLACAPTRRSASARSWHRGGHAATPRSRPRREENAAQDFPYVEIFPKRSLPPLECIFGVNPIHAAKCRPEVKASGSGTNAWIVGAVIGPIPGIVAIRRMVSSRRTSVTISRSSMSIRCVSCSIWSASNLSAVLELTPLDRTGGLLK